MSAVREMLSNTLNPFLSDIRREEMHKDTKNISNMDREADSTPRSYLF